MKAKDGQQVATSNKKSFKESLEVSLLNNQTFRNANLKFAITGRIDNYETYEHMKSLHLKLQFIQFYL